MARAGVLLDQVQPLDGDEELVVPGITELHEFLVLADVQTDLLQSNECADAVIDMDDRIANLQIAQVGQERSRLCPPPLGAVTFLFEDVGLGIDDEPAFRQPESARQAAESDQERCRVRVFGPSQRSGQQGCSPVPSR